MIFNLTQKYKHIIFSLLILLMSSCNSGPSISSAQKNFTEGWRNFLNKYLDSDTSVSLKRRSSLPKQNIKLTGGN